MKNFVQPGRAIPYTNGGSDTITSGSIVALGTLIGVAATDIAVDATGEIVVEGVFDLPKASGEISAGDLLSFDSSAGYLAKSFTPAEGDVLNCAIAVADAASADTVVRARLLPGGGSLPE